jgi:hypothetical protein
MAAGPRKERLPDDSPGSTPGTDAPYTIFDSRQKWLVVFIVSFAATCKPDIMTAWYALSVC